VKAEIKNNLNFNHFTNLHIPPPPNTQFLDDRSDKLDRKTFTSLPETTRHRKTSRNVFRKAKNTIT
jgi:hypothetical protein